MKKVYISIASLLLCGSMLMAQSPANRTSKTIVADVLAHQDMVDFGKNVIPYYLKSGESVFAYNFKDVD